MNLSPKKARSEWVKALRSGKYRQGTHVLRSPVDETYCCLGVACDLYADLEDNQMAKWEDDTAWTFLGHVCTMPNQVGRWLGIKPKSSFSQYLSARNDSGETFEKIADHIEMLEQVKDKEAAERSRQLTKLTDKHNLDKEVPTDEAD